MKVKIMPRKQEEKLCFDDFKRDFRYNIIIRTAFPT